MKLSISRNELSDALQTVSSAISPNSPQHALKGILMEVKDSELIITGSDADISIRKTIQPTESNKLTIESEGSILVDASWLTQICRKIDSDILSIDNIDGSLTYFRGKSAEFKINGMMPADYPNIDFSEPESSLMMPAGLFSEIIDQTKFAASTKETRPVLTGVNFRIADGTMICTSTDSYRLAKKTIPFSSDTNVNITIPGKTLDKIRSTMLSGNNDTISFSVDSRKAQFRISGLILQSRLLDGVYPDTDRLIPAEFADTLTINRVDLIRALDRSMFMKSDNMIINRLDCSETSVVLSNKSQEVGEFNEELFCNYIGENLSISFSANYLADAAKSLKSDDVVLKFPGPMKPFILMDPKDESILHLVLPVRTYN